MGEFGYGYRARRLQTGPAIWEQQVEWRIPSKNNLKFSK